MHALCTSLQSHAALLYSGLRVVALLSFAAGSPLLLAQENTPPGVPGEIRINEITAHSAIVAWGPAADADNDPLIYQVWLRARSEGRAQPWLPPHETRATQLVWDGLLAGTVYDVKVVAFDGKAFGGARLRELAFTTLAAPEGNHAPGTPAGLGASEVAARRVRLSWSASSDADHDVLVYFVSVRKRAEGRVSEWLPAIRTSNTSIVWDGLEPETVYDARVRASDGKSFSPWYLKEEAFRTTSELNAPTRPGDISVSEVTSTAATISWGAATGPAGVTVVYVVQMRARIEGVPQPWKSLAETRQLSVRATGLVPGTLYDVQVRGWANAVPGLWVTKEGALRTLSEGIVNHPPTRPGPFGVSALSPFSVRLSWEPSSDPDGDQIAYSVSLRARINGDAQPWSPWRATDKNFIDWDGLKPETMYEVRIRAWDGRVFSEIYLKENAFTTPGIGKLGNFVSRSDPNLPDGNAAVLVVWPVNGGSVVLESSDTGNGWAQCQEVETDGIQNRALLPMDAKSRFFRVRQ